jgi:DNA (cytosine-5)-methyltransferase 1
MKTLKVNDLFCGAGGMGLGFKQAGFEIAGAWDFDKYAVESYKHNVGDHVVQANILDMTHEDMPYADVWTFGAPCQAFSVAGKQLGMTFKCPSCKHEETFEGELIIDRQTFCSECGALSEPKDIRGIMFFEVMRLLKNTEDKPPVIMLENVKGISKFLDVVAYEYEKRGYKLYQTLYNSKYWGVPQNRERYFVVGVHESIEKEFEFPIQQDKYIPRLSTILENEVDEKYYVNSEKTKGIIEQVGDKLRIREATKKGYAEAGEGDTLNISHPKSKTRRGRWGNQVAQTLLTGQEQVVVEPTGIRLKDNARTFSNFQEITEPVMARDYKGWSKVGMVGVIESDLRIRKLTPTEYKRLQGFPESFEIVVSNSQAYKQFGNAVTVNVSQAIAERLKMFLLSL